MAAGLSKITVVGDADYMSSHPAKRSLIQMFKQLRQSLGDRLSELSTIMQPFVDGWRWIVAGCLVGVGPLLICWCLQLPGQQLFSALGLTLLLLPMVAKDRWLAGPSLLGTTFFAHCVVAIGLTYYQPAATAPLMPDAPAYWDKQRNWIETGTDPEYELSAWVPAHLQLAVGATIYNATSLGSLTFMQGFYEVDLMNFYLGQLMRNSEKPSVAARNGWHIWSILRGIGFVFLTFETVSLSFAWITQLKTSPVKMRAIRWTLGLTLLVADGVVKIVFLEPVRKQLESNMIDGE